MQVCKLGSCVMHRGLPGAMGECNAPGTLGEVGAANVAEAWPSRVSVVVRPDIYNFAVHEKAGAKRLAVAQQLAREGGRVPPLGLEADGSGALGENTHERLETRRVRELRSIGKKNKHLFRLCSGEPSPATGRRSACGA